MSSDNTSGGIGEELKSVGQSVISQITGSTGSKGGGDSADASEQLGGFGKSILGQVTGSGTSGESVHGKSAVSGGFWDQMKAFGSSVLGQISGKDLQEMKKKDEQFRQAGEAEIRAKIEQMYGEHAQKKKQEEHVVEQQEKHVEKKQNEFEKQEKKRLMDVEIAQTKAKAEIKNLGAE